MKVEIDGVRYVPEASIQHTPESNVMMAVREMAVARYLYGAPHGCRSEEGAWWSAIRLLTGDEFAALLHEKPREACLSIGAFEE